MDGRAVGRGLWVEQSLHCKVRSIDILMADCVIDLCASVFYIYFFGNL